MYAKTVPKSQSASPDGNDSSADKVRGILGRDNLEERMKIPVATYGKAPMTTHCHSFALRIVRFFILNSAILRFFAFQFYTRFSERMRFVIFKKKGIFFRTYFV